MKHITAAGSFAPQKTTMYNKFKGVDFSADSSSISRDRSPYAPNMISDSGSTPEKRLGWRMLYTFPTESIGGVDTAMPVNGIFSCTIGTTEYTLAHVGTKIYTIPTSGALGAAIATGLNNAKSTAVYAMGALYIFTGLEYLVFNGTNCVAVTGKIPQITIGRAYNGGGTAFETINLLSAATMDSFYITKAVLDTPNKTFFSSFQNLDAYSDTKKVLFEFQMEGYWQPLYEGWLGDGDVPFITVDRTAGSITLSEQAHTWFSTQGVFVDGFDNARLTVYKTRSGDADKIKKATSAVLYNGFLFCAGATRGTDYRSAFDDPTYFPADGYDAVGTTNTDIMGYLRVGEYLAIVKEDNDQDATIFFRYDTTDSNGNVIFKREQAIAGIGAVSSKCFASMRGEPLFLSREGVFAITANDLNNQRIVQNRSGFVDLQLTRESTLSAACAAVWNGWYVLVVNDKAYVLDATQNKSFQQETTSYWNECFHWTNIPAICLLSREGELFFGTDDGKLCKFNTDITDSTKYSDGETGAFVAIDASWSTKVDDDGNFAEKKSLMRAGTAVMIKPYANSSMEVYVTSERETSTVVALQSGFFDMVDFDFASLTFNTLETPQVLAVRTASRKYHTLQITMRNAVVNQGFGVYGVVKRFYSCGVIR